MRYRPSRYNILMNKDKPYLLFNTLYRSLSAIEDDSLDRVKRIINSKIIEKDGDAVLEHLIAGRFVIPADFDERAYLKLAYFKTKFDTDVLELVIFVTKACNFRCSYCFENTDIAESLDDEQHFKILRFVESRIRRAQTMLVYWFGGEPLLRLDIIEKLTKHFMKICDDYACRYAACISTNGYLLTPEVVNRLVDWKVKRIQTTIDGPPTIHDQRRMLKTGGPTYDTILGNLKNIVGSSVPIEVTVRCNVDKENLAHIKPWLENFPADIKNKFEIQFSPTTPTGVQGCPAQKRKGICFDALESGIVVTDFLRSAAEHGFNLDFKLPMRNVYCNRDKANQYIIDTDLSLVACHVGMDRFGRISERGEAELDAGKHLAWFAKDPFEDQVCRRCKSLPICMGGCNLVRFRTGKRGCVLFKHNINRWVRFMYDIKTVSARKRSGKSGTR